MFGDAFFKFKINILYIILFRYPLQCTGIQLVIINRRSAGTLVGTSVGYFCSLALENLKNPPVVLPPDLIAPPPRVPADLSPLRPRRRRAPSRSPVPSSRAGPRRAALARGSSGGATPLLGGVHARVPVPRCSAL
jgi:hypothetical protein